jgi:MOSC domain-containing protein YiiM
VHLIHSELFDEPATAGYTVRPGELGENITTSGIDLLGLPTGTLLHLGDRAVVEVTGLRNPCPQIDDYQRGLLKHVIHRDGGGNVVRKAGIMGIARAGGAVRPGDHIRVVRPDPPHRRLGRVQRVRGRGPAALRPSLWPHRAPGIARARFDGWPDTAGGARVWRCGRDPGVGWGAAGR